MGQYKLSKAKVENGKTIRIKMFSECVTVLLPGKEVLSRESFEWSKRGQLEVKTNALHPSKAPNKYFFCKMQQINFKLTDYIQLLSCSPCVGVGDVHFS